MPRSPQGAEARSRVGDGGAARRATRRARQRALCIAAGPEPVDLGELRELLHTAGVAVAGELQQRRERPDPDRYFGRGKLAELKQAVAASDANLIACDDELLPRQERNLEQEIGLPVIDRTATILDIFALHANSAEGKLQVELAQLEYNLARMRGLWTHLERLAGGIGTRGPTRGPGETQIETDRRLARDRVAAIRRRLERTRATRRVMRRERERASLPTVALAGYTNAGKSTLLNALTGADVGVRDRLFHTLDPTTRTLEISGRTYLMTDTVGFIRKLPHQLVEAFAATLEEALEADLLLHVVDASVPEEEIAGMVEAVDSVLVEIGAAERPRVVCLNKVDRLDAERRRELSYRHPDAVQVSAQTGEGLEDVRSELERRFEDSLRTVDLLLPYGEGGRLSELHELAGHLEREDTPEGVRIRARLPVGATARFRPFAVPGAGPLAGDAESGAVALEPAPLAAEADDDEESPRVAGAGGR